jgi:hypothetical protein
MIDKLDLEVPRAMPFKADFARHWYNPQNDELFKKRTGGLYAVQGDLRAVGIPAMISAGHKHHEKLGPKLEIIGAGAKTYSEWVAIHEQIFNGEVEECSILRADLTADIHGVPVDAFGRAMWCRYKHTNQQEFGDLPPLHSRVNRFAAQTLYHGKKPRQIRFYDKTLHRLKVLLPAINREQKRRGRKLTTFFEEFGYDPSEIITRVERQMGARETSEAWGVRTFGDIPRLMKCDPFERLRIVEDAEGVSLSDLDGQRRSWVAMMRERIERDGLDYSRSWLMGFFDRPNSFRKFWRENERYILDPHPRISVEMLTGEYRKTLQAQLAA